MALWDCKEIRGGRATQYAPDTRNVEVSFATLLSLWNHEGDSTRPILAEPSESHGIESPDADAPTQSNRTRNATDKSDSAEIARGIDSLATEPCPEKPIELPRSISEVNPTPICHDAQSQDRDESFSNPIFPAPTPEVRSMPANLNAVCQEVMENTAESIACGVVDLNTGMMLGAHHTLPYFTQAYLDAVAAAAVDMFRGKNVKRIEDLLTKTRGKSAKDSFEEVQVTTPNSYHFMKVIKEKNAVVVLVTRRTASLGMGWAALRNSIVDLSAAM
jgi:hypothetical protein